MFCFKHVFHALAQITEFLIVTLQLPIDKHCIFCCYFLLQTINRDSADKLRLLSFQTISRSLKCMMKFSAEKSQKFIINNELVDITMQVVFDPFIHRSKQIGNFTFIAIHRHKIWYIIIVVFIHFTDFPTFFHTIFTICN